MNAVLARFLRAVERLARQYTNDTPISRAVRFVFVKYDVDGSGLIDEQELSAIITDLINGDGGTSKVFLKCFFFFFFKFLRNHYIIVVSLYTTGRFVMYCLHNMSYFFFFI